MGILALFSPQTLFFTSANGYAICEKTALGAGAIRHVKEVADLRIKGYIKPVELRRIIGLEFKAGALGALS